MTPRITQRLSFAAIGAAMLMLASPAFVSPVMARDGVRPGEPAPDFTIADTSGKPVTLSSFKGKTVGLEWTNHECPYVGKHYGTGTMQKLQNDAQADGVAWLTIISSSAGQQGHVEGLEADKLTADRNAAPAAD